MYLFYVFIRFFIIPLGILAAVFILIKRLTKGRYGKTEYLIKIFIVSILQVFFSYKPEFYYFYFRFRYFYLLEYVLYIIFFINIYVSTKKLNDAVNDGNNNYLLYFSPIANLIIYLGYYLFMGLAERYVFNEQRPGFLSALILANIIPIITLYLKDYDINIKRTDVPVKYRDIFGNFDKDYFLIEINNDCIYTGNFRFSVRHSQNKHSIISFKDIDNENILIKYLMEKGIERLGFHYHNKYFELTDEEYNDMISGIKNMKNVIFINYPYMVIKDVNIYIRNDGVRCAVVLKKKENEKLYNEVYLLKNISKKAENEEYICYSEIRKKDIIWWIQKITQQRQYLQLGD